MSLSVRNNAGFKLTMRVRYVKYDTSFHVNKTHSNTTYQANMAE